MKKILCLLLSFGIVCSCFVGCSKTEEPEFTVPLPADGINTAPTTSVDAPVDEITPTESIIMESVQEGVQKEEITPLPANPTVGDIFDRVLITLRQAEGVCAKLTIHVNAELAGKSYDATATTKINNRTGEVFYRSEEWDSDGEVIGLPYSGNETYIVWDDMSQEYVSYERDIWDEQETDVVYRLCRGYDDGNIQNLPLTALMFEPFISYTGEKEVIDGKSYHVLKGASVPNSKIIMYISEDNFELRSAKIYIGYESDDRYIKLSEMKFTYAAQEIEAPNWKDKAVAILDCSQKESTNFFGSKYAPIADKDLIVTADNVQLSIGSSAADLFDAQFSCYEWADLKTLSQLDIEEDDVDATPDTLLKPGEIAKCCLDQIVRDETEENAAQHALLGWKYYDVYIYNSTDEPLAIRDCTISALVWTNAFLDDMDVCSLSFIDCRALFGSNMRGTYTDNGLRGIIWDKDEYTIGVELYAKAYVIVAQLKNGPDIFTAYLEQE